MADADFTMSEILAWARTKPAAETYDYCDARKCAVAQFGRDTGRDYLIGIGDLRDDHRELYELVNAQFFGPNRIQWDFSSTYGALVSRLEIVCGLTPVTQSNWTRADAYLADIESVSA